MLLVGLKRAYTSRIHEFGHRLLLTIRLFLPLDFFQLELFVTTGFFGIRLFWDLHKKVSDKIISLRIYISSRFISTKT